jgi:hypothetical protein
VSDSQELRLEAAKMAMIKKFNFERDENGEVVAVVRDLAPRAVGMFKSGAC